MVVLDHSMQHYQALGPAFDGVRDLAGTLGRMGVNTFFIISGFIMVRSTTGSTQLTPWARVSSFLSRRSTRLVPLYWVATFAALGTEAVLGRTHGVGEMVRSLMFLPNPYNAVDYKLPPVLGVGWSLNYEVFFYLIFAASLLLPRKAGLWACLATIVGLVLVGPLLLRFVAAGPVHRVVAFYTFKNMVFFAAGIGIAMVSDRLPSIRYGVSVLASIGALAVAVVVREVVGFAEVSMAWQLINMLACATAVVCATAGAGAGANHRMGRLLQHAGNASYSTYLFHTLVIDLLITAIRGASLGVAPLAFVLVTSVLAQAIGSAIHLYVEIPITRALRPRSARNTVILNA
jgi:exopolysaccharide production protein ExoZ